MAILDTIIITVLSLLMGGIGIFAGVRLLTDDTIGVESAFFTSLPGALVWGTVSFFVGLVPVVAPLSALVVWIVVLDARYPRGWGTAAAIGFVAWFAAVVALYALGTVGVVSLSALGVPDVAHVIPAVTASFGRERGNTADD